MARMLRLHLPDGRVVVEPLTRTARANGLTGVNETLVLIATWVRRGYLRAREDGGYDVKMVRPRPDTATVKFMRFADSIKEP